ncbi:hypothetical protein [Actinomadura madurae]|uniref:hypothetical protein n=1 Tax=Actinomadura madurae TaxID=1993 RepID=UPI0020D2040D|nr:hypothetical protein [Actinomadura madurae]MCP9955721.1 hypothetical protein [Actinomadura madurae]MCP9972452.1 hypothetical protein [Actinomadura madurae]MCP9984964.1 hypothetical protein [Actinomadura madurae]MCQ0003475.1 hypothetical protein [Actinomadura madurae]MCQ0021163.1 hypothetical protein [Actinomadura madurae]
MRPTVTEQLDGVRRLLDLVAADEDLSPSSRARLRDAGRLLAHVRRSCTELPSFLAEDNARLAALLGEDDHPDQCVQSVQSVQSVQRNDELRASLARTIRELPATDAGTRDRIRSYLRWRVATDPS